MTVEQLYKANELSKQIKDLEGHFKEIENTIITTKKKPEERPGHAYYINGKKSICIPTSRDNYGSEINLRTDFINPVELAELYLEKGKAKLKELQSEFENL